MAGHDEQAAVEASLALFLEPVQRARFKTLLGLGRREEALDTLCFLQGFVAGFSSEIPPGGRTAPRAVALLRGRGAPDDCWFFRFDDDMSLTRERLDAAVAEAWEDGGIVVCVPGRLVLVASDEPGLSGRGRLILERPR